MLSCQGEENVIKEKPLPSSTTGNSSPKLSFQHVLLQNDPSKNENIISWDTRSIFDNEEEEHFRDEGSTLSNEKFLIDNIISNSMDIIDDESLKESLKQACRKSYHCGTCAGEPEIKEMMVDLMKLPSKENVFLEMLTVQVEEERVIDDDSVPLLPNDISLGERDELGLRITRYLKNSTDSKRLARKSKIGNTTEEDSDDEKIESYSLEDDSKTNGSTFVHTLGTMTGLTFEGDMSTLRRVYGLVSSGNFIDTFPATPCGECRTIEDVEDFFSEPSFTRLEEDVCVPAFQQNCDNSIELRESNEQSLILPSASSLTYDAKSTVGVEDSQMKALSFLGPLMQSKSNDSGHPFQFVCTVDDDALLETFDSFKLYSDTVEEENTCHTGDCTIESTSFKDSFTRDMSQTDKNTPMSPYVSKGGDVDVSVTPILNNCKHNNTERVVDTSMQISIFESENNHDPHLQSKQDDAKDDSSELRSRADKKQHVIPLIRPPPEEKLKKWENEKRGKRSSEGQLNTKDHISSTFSVESSFSISNSSATAERVRHLSQLVKSWDQSNDLTNPAEQPSPVDIEARSPTHSVHKQYSNPKMSVLHPIFVKNKELSDTLSPRKSAKEKWVLRSASRHNEQSSLSTEDVRQGNDSTTSVSTNLDNNESAHVIDSDEYLPSNETKAHRTLEVIEVIGKDSLDRFDPGMSAKNSSSAYGEVEELSSSDMSEKEITAVNVEAPKAREECLPSSSTMNPETNTSSSRDEGYTSDSDNHLENKYVDEDFVNDFKYLHGCGSGIEKVEIERADESGILQEISHPPLDIKTEASFNTEKNLGTKDSGALQRSGNERSTTKVDGRSKSLDESFPVAPETVFKERQKSSENLSGSELNILHNECRQKVSIGNDVHVDKPQETFPSSIVIEVKETEISCEYSSAIKTSVMHGDNVERLSEIDDRKDKSHDIVSSSSNSEVEEEPSRSEFDKNSETLNISNPPQPVAIIKDTIDHNCVLDSTPCLSKLPYTECKINHSLTSMSKGSASVHDVNLAEKINKASAKASDRFEESFDDHALKRSEIQVASLASESLCNMILASTVVNEDMFVNVCDVRNLVGTADCEHQTQVEGGTNVKKNKESKQKSSLMKAEHSSDIDCLNVIECINPGSYLPDVNFEEDLENTQDIKSQMSELSDDRDSKEYVVTLPENEPASNPDQSKKIVKKKDRRRRKRPVQVHFNYLRPPSLSPSPFETALKSMPSILSLVLAYVGDPVSLCNIRGACKLCSHIISENEHILMRESVRAGGMNRKSRASFWLWITLEKCGKLRCDVPSSLKRETESLPSANTEQPKKRDHSEDNEKEPMSRQTCQIIPLDDYNLLERYGQCGEWHNLIQRDVARAFGNLPPHKTGARISRNSIAPALVYRPTLQRYFDCTSSSSVPGIFDREDDHSSKGSIEPTDTVSEWGACNLSDSDSGVIFTEEDDEVCEMKTSPREKSRKSRFKRTTSETTLNGYTLSAEAKLEMQNMLQRILNALAAAHPHVGYCQGMDYVVAHLLRVLKDTITAKAKSNNLPPSIRSKFGTDCPINVVIEETIFRVMDTFFSVYDLRYMYWPGLSCLKLCCRIFEKLIRMKLPVLSDHFDHHDLNVGIFALGWFQTLFLYLPAMPSSTVCQIWDIWLVERSFKIFFRVGVAILFLSQPILLNHEMEGMMNYLNTFGSDVTLFNPEILITCALRVKITNRMLLELEEECMNESNHCH